MNDLTLPPVARTTLSLQQIIEQMTDLVSLVNSTESRKNLLASLCEHPRLDFDALLETHVKSLRAAVHQVAHWETVTARLGSLANLTARADTTPIEGSLRSLRNAANEIGRFEEHVQQAQAQLDEAVADLQAWAAEAVICPTCGGDIDSEKLLAQSQHCLNRNHV